MKKQMSLFVWAVAMFGMSPVFGATNTGARAASSVDLTGLPAVRSRDNVNYNKYQTKTTTTTYTSKDAGNVYYTQPAKRSDLYKQYDAANASRSVRKTRTETYRTTAKRKYFLSHPFFQPLKGKFGSITDLSYASNSFDITAHPSAFQVDISDGSNSATVSVLPDADTASWKTKQFTVKEDFSFGITDRIALVGMLQYNSTDHTLDWASFGKKELSDNGLNLYGIGGQWRFVDNEKWIATASAYFQHQKDTSNNFILDIKGGYKIASTTVYGLGRAWYVDIDGDAYGYGVTGTNEYGHPEAEFIVNSEESSALFFEAGVGAFSVLDQDWTLNIEATFGHYDWHNQLAARAAFGWQLNDWFALNIYGKIALHDSADNQKLTHKYYGFLFDYDLDGDSVKETYEVPEWVSIGKAEISDYTETTIGMQAIFMF